MFKTFDKQYKPKITSCNGNTGLTIKYLEIPKCKNRNDEIVMIFSQNENDNHGRKIYTVVTCCDCCYERILSSYRVRQFNIHLYGSTRSINSEQTVFNTHNIYLRKLGLDIFDSLQTTQVKEQKQIKRSINDIIFTFIYTK